MGYSLVDNRMYTPNTGDNNVSVIDTNTNTVLPTLIPVGTSPTGLEFDSANKKCILQILEIIMYQ